MKAAILNSGTGSRMGALTRNIPKCLIGLTGDETILSRQIRQIESCGIRDFVITTGPFEAKIKGYVDQNFRGLSVSYVHNPEYTTTNYIFSMHLADSLLRDDILLLHGDIVTTQGVIKAVVHSTQPDVAVVDSTAALPSDDFKARIENDRITAIGVNITGPDCVALLPVYRLSRGFMAVWMDEINRFIDKNLREAYAEEAFNRISADLRLGCIESMGHLCEEIDTEEDLERVREIIGFTEDETD